TSKAHHVMKDAPREMRPSSAPSPGNFTTCLGPEEERVSRWPRFDPAT
ncbi:hypothetical protein CEXT_450401, partial [Caerostris extrusa]